MGKMKETMDFLNSFMPEAICAGLLIFAALFYWKYKNENKDTSTTTNSSESK